MRRLCILTPDYIPACFLCVWSPVLLYSLSVFRARLHILSHLFEIVWDLHNADVSSQSSAASFMPMLQLSQFLQIVWLHKNINSKQNVALLI